MSVEEFYYGKHVGDQNVIKPLPLGIKPPTFTCQICKHLANNNLRLESWDKWTNSNFLSCPKHD